MKENKNLTLNNFIQIRNNDKYTVVTRIKLILILEIMIKQQALSVFVSRLYAILPLYQDGHTATGPAQDGHRPEG